MHAVGQPSLSLSLSLSRMARFLSQARTLFRHCSSRSSSFNCTPLMPLSVYNCQTRHTSSKSQMIEVEIDSSSSPVSSSSSSSSSYSDGRGLDFSLAVQEMEDLIQVLLEEKSTPNWLPFIPGSSFWVPPHSPTLAPDLIIKLVDRLTEDEIMAVTTLRGWPSSSYFIPEVKAEVLQEANTDLEMLVNTSQAKDTEG